MINEMAPRFDSLDSSSNLRMIADLQRRVKHLEAELAARRDVEVALAVQRKFMSFLAHEIRSPLGTVLGFAELAKDAASSEDERAEYLETIVRNGNQLNRLIDDILDLTKAWGGDLAIEPSEFSPEELVLETVGGLRPQAEAKGLSLVVRVDGPLPSAMIGDACRLQQILAHMIDGAIRMTKAGVISVALGASVERKGIEIEILDSATPLPAEHVERIFSPTTPEDVSVLKKHVGANLGLLLAKKVACAMGGDIKFSPLERGNRFVIAIPTTSY